MVHKHSVSSQSFVCSSECVCAFGSNPPGGQSLAQTSHRHCSTGLTTTTYNDSTPTNCSEPEPKTPEFLFSQEIVREKMH